MVFTRTRRRHKDLLPNAALPTPLSPGCCFAVSMRTIDCLYVMQMPPRKSTPRRVRAFVCSGGSLWWLDNVEFCIRCVVGPPWKTLERFPPEPKCSVCLTQAERQVNERGHHFFASTQRRGFAKQCPRRTRHSRFQ